MDTEQAAVSAYLGDKVFYLNIDQIGSYCYFKKSYFESSMSSLDVQLKNSIYANSHDSFLLVSIRKANEKEIRCGNSVFQFQELSRFKNGIIKPDYYIYNVIRRGNSYATVIKTK